MFVEICNKYISIADILDNSDDNSHQGEEIMNTNGQFPNGNNRFPNGMPGQPGQNFQPNNAGVNAQGFNPQQPTGNIPPINRQMPPNPNAVPRQTGVVPPVNGQMPMGAQRGPINGPQQQRPVNSAPAQAVNPNMRQNIRPTVNIVPTQNVPVSQAARPTAGNNTKGTAVLPKIPNTMVVNPNVIVQDPNMRPGAQGSKNKTSSPLIAVFSILIVAAIAVGAALY